MSKVGHIYGNLNPVHLHGKAQNKLTIGIYLSTLLR